MTGMTPRYRVTPLTDVHSIFDAETALAAMDSGKPLGDGHDPHGDNVRRAHFAALAMRAYGELAGTAESESALLTIQDFLTDLRHLLDALSGLSDEETDGYPRGIEGLLANDRYDEEIRGVL